MATRKRTELTDREREMSVMRLTGATLVEIGYHFNLSRDRVRVILKRTGVRKPPKPLKPPKSSRIPEELFIRAKQLSVAGLSGYRIAKILGINESTVYSWQKRGFSSRT